MVVGSGVLICNQRRYRCLHLCDYCLIAKLLGVSFGFRVKDRDGCLPAKRVAAQHVDSIKCIDKQMFLSTITAKQ